MPAVFLTLAWVRCVWEDDVLIQAETWRDCHDYPHYRFQCSFLSQSVLCHIQVETVQYKNINFTTWDVSGRNKIRPYDLIPHFTSRPGCGDIITKTRPESSSWLIRMTAIAFLKRRYPLLPLCSLNKQDELHRLMRENELQNTVLLVLANKQGPLFFMTGNRRFIRV